MNILLQNQSLRVRIGEMLGHGSFRSGRNGRHKIGRVSLRRFAEVFNPSKLSKIPEALSSSSVSIFDVLGSFEGVDTPDNLYRLNSPTLDFHSLLFCANTTLNNNKY